MRIDSNVAASVMSAVKPASGNQQIGQLIDLAIQKQGIRGDASIPAEAKSAMLAKLDNRSAPIQQGMESDQARMTTQELIEEAERVAEEARKAGEANQGQPAQNIDGDTAVSASTADATDVVAVSSDPAPAPVTDEAASPVGQNVDDYA